MPTRLDDWNGNGEPRSCSRLGLDFDRVLEQIGKTPDDRKAETESLLARTGGPRLVKFLEYRFQLVGFDPDSRIDDFDSSAVAAAIA